MSGWGNPIARFYGPTNLSSPVDVSGTTHTALSCGGTENVFSSGEGWATFVYEAKFDTLAARGNVVWITQVSDVRGGAFTVIQPFTVTDTEYDANADLITVRGPFLADELRRYMIARPLGHETTISTKLAAAAAGPVTGRSMDVGSPAGNDTFKVTSPSNADNGKELRVKMDDDNWFVSEIVEIRDWEGAKYLITRDRNPVDAGAGKPVELRTLQVKLDSMSGVAAGQEITITMDSGSHATLIDRIVPGEDGGMVVLRDGMTGSAAVNKTVTIKDYSLPSTNDVTNVMAFAPGWSVSFSAGGATGTARGTRYPGGGETVQGVLKSIADETGEFYRLRSADYGTPGPKREIIWRRTSDTAGDGANLKLVQGSTSDIATAQANKNRGIIISPPEYKRVFDPITAIFPVAGDARVTLFSCSDTAITDATTAGFTVKTTGLGLYAPPYIEDTALTSSIGLYQRTVTFSEVIVEGDSVGSIRAAADRLMYLAIRYMRERANATEQLTVRCVTPMEIRPGQTVDVEYDAPTGSYSIDDTFYVQSVRREVGPDSQGTPITTVTLTPSYLAVPTESREIGRRLAAVDRAITRIGSPSQIRLSIPGGSGNTPPVSPPPPPVVGSDHDPVTAADTSVTVTGQAIKVNPASSGGLEVSSGLKVKADAGKAIELGASGVGVTLATNGGLKMDSGISLKFPANAGIKLDGTGAYLDPDTLTYATTNTVTGSKHTHAITTTANAKTTPNTILRGDINGDVGMRFLTADRVVTPLIESAAGAITLNPASGVLSVNANIALTGARNITTTSGSLTLSPAQTLIFQPTNNVVQINATTTLKTAHWASGFMGTGWGVTYDGALDARSIYADELHVAAFIADTTRVKAGADMITPSRSTLSRNFTIPALNATGSMFVEDMPGLEDMPVFADDDWVLLHVIHRPTGGLLVFNVWGQVSGYVDKSDGEQQWTFKTKYYTSATAVGKVAGAGMQVLDFGKSGDGWITLTSIDPAGSPYIDVATWQGGDPYTPGNIQHWYRDGQLRGITGIHEWGMRAGGGPSSHVKFSNLFNEIHGPRLSLYAGDHSKLQVSTVEVIHWRTNSQNTTLKPDADGSAIGVTSTAGNYWSVIDESAASPNHNDFVANEGDGGGSLFVGLSNPTWGSTTYKVDVKIVTKGVGFVNDTVRVYAQVFQSDEVTPLTGEALMRTQTNNSTNTTTVTLPQVNTTAKKADWDGARLRLRWEYDINTVKEAIRLDPNVPSIAVGLPLPTGYLDGGSGFWAGRDDGVDKVRIGAANGPNLRWTGDSLSIANAAGQDVVVVPASGTAYFANPVGLGASGGIYQGTGTFASPTKGLKIYNSGGQGRISFFDGNETMRLSADDGLSFMAINGSNIKTSLTFVGRGYDITLRPYGGLSSYTDYNSIYYDHVDKIYLWMGSGHVYGEAGARVYLTRAYNAGPPPPWGYNNLDIKVGLEAGDAKFELSPTYGTYAKLIAASLFIPDGGVAAGYSNIPNMGKGVYASDLHNGSNPAFVWQDTSNIGHGMTSIVDTRTYANLRKHDNTNGGIKLSGFTKTETAISLEPYVTTVDGVYSGNPMTSGKHGALRISAHKKSGTSAGAFADGDLLFTVEDDGASRFGVTRQGNFYYDGGGTAFDAEDDMGLISAIAHTWEGTVTQEWERFIGDNKTRLQEIGVLSGDFINGPALNRLMVGAMRQMMTRINQLEAKLA